MERRTFIATLAGGLLAAPLAAEAQPARKLPQLCFLTFDPGTARSPSPRFAAFFQGLQDLGYLNERTIAIHYLSADGHNERFPGLVAECLRLKPDIIAVTTTPAAQTAKTATSTVPIVMVALGDPQGTGLVDSLARPGGNITGLTNMAVELVPKRMQVFKEAIPGLSRMALLVNTSIPESARPYIEIAQTAARPLGVTLHPVEIRTAADIERAFSMTTQSRLQGMCLTSDGLIYVEQRRLAQLAQERSLPLIGYTREMAQWTGMLMTYGPSNVALFRRAAYFVDKILKGAKPANLPVEQPTKFELVINLKTAKALGLTIPPSLLRRADQIIE